MADENTAGPGPAPIAPADASAEKREYRQGDLVTHPDFPGSRGFVCGPNWKLKVVWRDGNSHPLGRIEDDLELLLAEDEFPGRLIEGEENAGEDARAPVLPGGAL